MLKCSGERSKYRGVEQLEARRAHNPEVVGSSPASATIKNTGFRKKSGVFLTFRDEMQQTKIDLTPILTPTLGLSWCFSIIRRKHPSFPCWFSCGPVRHGHRG